MTAKTLQIQGSIILRTATVTSFRAMKEEEKRIRFLSPQAQKLRGCINQYEGSAPEIQEYSQHVDVYYNSRSQAEATLS